MKELNLYKIRDMALKSGRAVYTSAQLANLIGKKKTIASVYVVRLIKKGLVKKLRSGTISFVDDEMVIAGQMLEPSYISLYSALLFHGLVQQVPKNVECVTPKNSRRYEDLGIIYHRIPSSLCFGYAKMRKGESYIMVAEPEKALIDGVYLNALPKNLVHEVMGKLDESKIRKYIERMRGRGRKKAEEWLL